MPPPEFRRGGDGERVAAAIVAIVLALALLLLLVLAFAPAWGAAAELADCAAVCVETHLEN
ncbi:hypothetical protein CNY89_09260 [Amaricoccus sp. HAR-UPW-R2A-40]|nr:hypothetical protein CNY89_09260 [Amaricoccus sp. HAR-UPW-R2A-40]